MQHGSLQLKAWQARTKHNQREAAKYLSIHYTTFNQFLRARRVPGRDLAVAIEKKTGIPVSAWSTRVGKVTKAQLQQAQSDQCLQDENA